MWFQRANVCLSECFCRCRAWLLCLAVGESLSDVSQALMWFRGVLSECWSLFGLPQEVTVCVFLLLSWPVYSSVFFLMSSVVHLHLCVRIMHLCNTEHAMCMVWYSARIGLNICVCVSQAAAQLYSNVAFAHCWCKERVALRHSCAEASHKTPSDCSQSCCCTLTIWSRLWRFIQTTLTLSYLSICNTGFEVLQKGYPKITIIHVLWKLKSLIRLLNTFEKLVTLKCMLSASFTTVYK